MPKKRGKTDLEGVSEPVENIKNLPKKRRASALDAGGMYRYTWMSVYVYEYVYL